MGEYANGGREYQPKGAPERVKVHDFVDPEQGRAIPYGVYDLGNDEGWVSVGDTADTAEFAVESIRRWWANMGAERFPKATRLLITADAGGSNGIPSVLITTTRPALEPIAAHLDGEDSRLTEISSWDELLSLPDHTRERIVVKCGSSHQFDNHGGHGVFRLGGSEGEARAILEPILARVAEGEPWIVQPFNGARWDVPVAHPSTAFDMKEASLYAKFGVYFRLPAQQGGQVDVLGGVTSLDTTWKVSGASGTPARIDESGVLVGAFRHDIRVAAGLVSVSDDSSVPQAHEGGAK